MTGLLTVSAQAYEQDTHLRMTYILTRLCGFSDDPPSNLALVAALSAQQIDSSVITSAMLTPSQRHLNHFPGSLEHIRTNAHGGTGGILTRLKNLLLGQNLSVTTRNHPLGSLEIHEGLQEDDLRKILVAFHTKQDTYGHAGYLSLDGHGTDGHLTDCKFAFPQRYQDMIRSMTASCISVRKLLPEEGVDLRSAIKVLNPTMQWLKQRDLTTADFDDPVLIAELILNNAELQELIREDVLRNQDYKKLTLKMVFDEWKLHKGYIHDGVEFADLFSDKLVDDRNLTISQTLFEVLYEGFKIDFATDSATSSIRNENGQELFNITSMFGEDGPRRLMSKIRFEEQRFQERLNNLPKLLEGYQSMKEARDPKGQAMYVRIQNEIDELGLSSQGIEAIIDRLKSSDSVAEQAQHLALEKLAEDLTLRLLKDFVPLKRDAYLVRQMEGEGVNRQFEKRYEDERLRRLIFKWFGTNWVFEQTTIIDHITAAYHAVVSLNGILVTEPTDQQWQAIAEQAAAAEQEGPSRAEAFRVTYSLKNRWQFIKSKLPRNALAMLPIGGDMYRRRLVERAKNGATDHEVPELLQQNVASGIYPRQLSMQTIRGALKITPPISSEPPSIESLAICEAIFMSSPLL